MRFSDETDTEMELGSEDCEEDEDMKDCEDEYYPKGLDYNVIDPRDFM